MARHTAPLVAILLITLIAALISGSIATSILDVARIQGLTQSVYNYKTDRLSNPQRFYEQQDLAQLLGATGITTQSQAICSGVQIGLDSVYANALNADSLNKLSAFAGLIQLYSCQNISISTQTTDVLDNLILSDSLYDIEVGLSLFSALHEQKIHHIDANRYDWADLLDLVQSLHLTDGLTRASVSTLSPSVRNTVVALDVAAQIVALIPDQQRTPKADDIDTSLTNISIAAIKISSGMCKPTSNIILGAVDYVDFFKAYATIHTALPGHNKTPLPIPIQCIISQIQSSLQSTQFGAVYGAIKFLAVLDAIKTSPVYNFTDLLTSSKALYLIQTPSVVSVADPKGADLKLVATAVEMISFLKFIPASPSAFSPTQIVTVSISPQSVLYQLTTTPIAESAVSMVAFLSTAGVKLIPASTVKSIYGSYTLSIASSNSTTPIYTTSLFVSGSTATKAGKISPTPPKKDQADVLFLIVDGKSSTKKQLTGTTGTPLTIDLSKELQVEVTMTHNKDLFSSLRVIPCPAAAAASKGCLSAPQSVLDSVTASTSTATSFFAPQKASKNAIAPVYFTSPKVKELILAQTHSNPAYLLVLDQVNLLTREAKAYYLGGFTTTVSNKDLFNEFYSINTASHTTLVQAQQMTSPDAPSTQQRSYLWDLIEPHFHTFAAPGRIANPFFATVFISLIVGLTAIFISTFLFKFKPTPNLSSAFGSINFLLFTIGLGSIPCALLIYWLKMTLFQAMVPAALIALPVAFAIGIPLRESVSSLRLYNLLYIPQQQQQQQSTNAKKHD